MIERAVGPAALVGFVATCWWIVTHMESMDGVVAGILLIMLPIVFFCSEMRP